MSDLSVTFNVISPPEYKIVYNDGNTSVNIHSGEAKTLPFEVEELNPDPVNVVDLVISTSISDPTWSDSIDPSNVSGADLQSAPVTGKHTVNCPSAAVAGTAITINFVITPVAKS